MLIHAIVELRHSAGPNIHPDMRPAEPAPRHRQHPPNASLSPRETADTPRREYDVSEPSLTPAPAAFQQAVVQYVGRGTQWYSPPGQKTEAIRPAAISLIAQPLRQLEPLESLESTVSVPTNVPPSRTKPPLRSESPSLERRQSPGTDWSAAHSNKELARRRISSAPRATRILPDMKWHTDLNSHATINFLTNESPFRGSRAEKSRNLLNLIVSKSRRVPRRRAPRSAFSIAFRWKVM
jgi:hypothetical protein